LPIIAQVAVGKLEKLKVTGNDYATPDGTGIRDYVHVVDLALGHIAALNKLDERGSENCLIYNLGTGKGYSVLEVLAAYEKACGFKIAFEFAPRRPGDSAVSYADTAKAAKELSWSAKLGIDDMCSDSWNWQKNNPDGYR
jgi:UDP-glucose 4-epimerase